MSVDRATKPENRAFAGNKTKKKGDNKIRVAEIRFETTRRYVKNGDMWKYRMVLGDLGNGGNNNTEDIVWARVMMNFLVHIFR